MSNRWIKIHSKIWKNPRSNDPEWVAVWIYLLCHVAWEPKDVIWKGKRITIQPGQMTTGRKLISQQTGVHASKVRRVLDCLESEQQISQQMSSKCRLITINNWIQYQANDQQIDQQIASNRPTTGQQLATSYRILEYKNNTYKGTLSPQAVTSQDLQKEKKEILDCYVSEFKVSFCKLTDKRSKLLSARLKSWKVEQIQNAIKNYASNPFYLGQNDRNWKADLDFIIRTDEQIEKGLNLKPKIQKSLDEARKNMYSSLKQNDQPIEDSHSPFEG